MSTDDPGNDILEQAALWVVRMNEPGEPLSAPEHARFQDWLLADERHQIAFRTVSSIPAMVSEMPADTRARLKEWAAKHGGDRASSRRHFFRWGALAAGVLTVLLVGGLFAKSRGYFAESYSTRTGETRVVTFEEGSVAYLNTQTEVRWLGDEHDRRVALVKGEALFDVVHDENRPFRVMLGESEIQVLGTRFNVYRKVNGEVAVTVLEGTVEVRGYGAGADHTDWTRILHADQKIQYRPIGLMQEPHPTVALNAVKWRAGFLQFEGTPLPEVVEELMRYTDQRIVIRDPSIVGVRVGGALSTRNVRSALEHLKDSGLPVELKEDNGTLVLQAIQAPAAQPQH
jgi:transmembrane sensor